MAAYTVGLLRKFLLKGGGQMFKRILFFVVTLLMLLANASAASACLANGYQPEMPETLRR